MRRVFTCCGGFLCNEFGISKPDDERDDAAVTPASGLLRSALEAAGERIGHAPPPENDPLPPTADDAE